MDAKEKELQEALRKVREIHEFGGDYWYSIERIIDRIHAMMTGFKEKGRWPPSRLPGPPPGSITLVRRRK